MVFKVFAGVGFRYFGALDGPLGLILALPGPIWSQNGSQNGSLDGPKSIQDGPSWRTRGTGSPCRSSMNKPYSSVVQFQQPLRALESIDNHWDHWKSLKNVWFYKPYSSVVQFQQPLRALESIENHWDHWNSLKNIRRYGEIRGLESLGARIYDKLRGSGSLGARITHTHTHTTRAHTYTHTQTHTHTHTHTHTRTHTQTLQFSCSISAALESIGKHW